MTTTADSGFLSDSSCITADGLDVCTPPVSGPCTAMGPGFFLFFEYCVKPHVPPVVPKPSPGRGSGPTSGIRREGYRKYHEDVKRESDIFRAKRDDDDILEILRVLLTKGIL